VPFEMDIAGTHVPFGMDIARTHEPVGNGYCPDACAVGNGYCTEVCAISDFCRHTQVLMLYYRSSQVFVQASTGSDSTLQVLLGLLQGTSPSRLRHRLVILQL